MKICRMCCGRWAPSAVRASHNSNCPFEMGTALVEIRMRAAHKLHKGQRGRLGVRARMPWPLRTPMHTRAFTCRWC